MSQTGKLNLLHAAVVAGLTFCGASSVMAEPLIACKPFTLQHVTRSQCDTLVAEDRQKNPQDYEGIPNAPAILTEKTWCRQFFDYPVTEQACHDAQMVQAKIDRARPPEESHWTVTHYKVMPRMDGSIDIIQQ
jgi:hypothetical protein